MTDKKVIHIRCKQTGFATLIPIDEWNKHDKLFKSGWVVTDPDAVEVVEPAKAEVTTAASEVETSPKKADKA